MKSIEEKAKAYDEAIKRAKALYDNNQPISGNNVIINNIFPELKKERENDMMRSMAIKAVYAPEAQSCIKSWGINPDDVIAWLEKQSTPQVRTGLEWVNTIDDACDKRYAEEYAQGEYCHEQSFKWGFQEGVDWLEKQGEQILANSAKTCKDEQKPVDKAEPKFKVGDVMRTLQEATDGIVGGMPVIISIDKEYYHCTNELIAIKDQNDYEYPPMNRATAWSEKDEKLLALSLNNLTELKDRFGEEYGRTGDCIEWLKSLKDRYTWKPSEEMLEALYRVIPENTMEISEDEMLLDKLYQGLKYGRVLSNK